MCWMIKQEAPECKKPKEQLRAYSELAATKGKGHGLGPPGVAAFTGLLQALSERGSTVGAANAAGVANLKQTWDDLELEGAVELVPHCKLAKVYDPALSRLETRHKRGTTSRAHSWCTRTNRSESSSRSSSKRSFGTGTVSSDRTDLKKSEFCCSITSRHTNQTPIATGYWRQGIASDEELMDRATGKMVGIDGSAISSMTGQLLTSAEIEEVRGRRGGGGGGGGHSCGALDPEFEAEEDAAREMYSQSDL